MFCLNSKTNEEIFTAIIKQRESDREKSNMLLLLLVVSMIIVTFAVFHAFAKSNVIVFISPKQLGYSYIHPHL